MNNKISYKDKVEKFQELIKSIIDKSTKLQAMEMKNKNKIESYLAGRKNEIKSFNVNNQTASNYYKNMAGQQSIGESYFLDQKK